MIERDVLIRVWDRGTDKVTFIVLNLQDTSMDGISKVVQAFIDNKNKSQSEKVFSYGAAGMAGSFDGWENKVLTAEQRKRNRRRGN